MENEKKELDKDSVDNKPQETYSSAMGLIECPNCGLMFKELEDYCPECGARIKRDSKV